MNRCTSFFLLASAGVVVALAASIASGTLDTYIHKLVIPQEPFDPEKVPPPPDYSLASSWLSHPKHVVRTSYVPSNVDFGRSTVSPVTESEEKKFDLFWVHPTSYFGGGWNARIDDPITNTIGNYVPMREQAAVFNDVAVIYAPRYRQCSQGAQDGFPLEEHQPAMDLAYSDVKNSFDLFRKENPGRPFFIGSYSQGSLHAMRLLQEWLPTVSKEEADLLVTAYLFGNTIPEEEMTDTLPVCTEPTQTKCYLSYNSILEGDSEAEKHWQKKGAPTCVNPLSWKHDEELVTHENHLGSLPCCISWWSEAPLFERIMFPQPHSQLVSAQCKDGVLHVSDPREKKGAWYWFQPGVGLHAYDINIFFVNVRLNIFDRATEWLKTKTS